MVIVDALRLVSHAASLDVVLARGSRVCYRTPSLHAFGAGCVSLARLRTSKLYGHGALAVLLKMADNVIDLALSVQLRSRVLVSHHKLL